MPPTRIAHLRRRSLRRHVRRAPRDGAARARRRAAVRHGRPAHARGRRRTSSSTAPKSRWSASSRSCTRCPRCSRAWRRLLRRNAPAQTRHRDPHRFPRLSSAPRARASSARASATSISSARSSGPGGRGRVNLVRRRFVRGLCIFPFEVDFYRKARSPGRLDRPSAGRSSARHDVPRRIRGAARIWTPQNRSWRCCPAAAPANWRSTCRS